MCWLWKKPFYLSPVATTFLEFLTLAGDFLASLRLRLLGKQHRLNVGKDSSLGNRHSRQQFVQFFVVPDGQLKVSRDDSRFLVVPGGVSSQLEDFCGEVLEDSRHVNRCSRTNSFGVVSFPQDPVDASHWKLEACSAWPGLGLGSLGLSFSSATHFDFLVVPTRFVHVFLQSFVLLSKVNDSIYFGWRIEITCFLLRPIGYVFIFRWRFFVAPINTCQIIHVIFSNDKTPSSHVI